MVVRIKYFEDTNTLFIKLKDTPIIETKELNENISLELDENGRVIGLTVEHAKEQSGDLDFSFERVAA